VNYKFGIVLSELNAQVITAIVKVFEYVE